MTDGLDDFFNPAAPQPVAPPSAPNSVDDFFTPTEPGLEQRRREWREGLLDQTRQTIQREADAGGHTALRDSTAHYALRRSVGTILGRDPILKYTYGKSKERFERNEFDESDLRNIALYEAEQSLDQRQGLGGKVLGAVASVPGEAAAFLAGGAAAKGLGLLPQVGGLTGAAHEAIVSGIFAPQLYLPPLMESNIQKGRDPLDLRDAPKEVAKAVVTMGILSGVGAGISKAIGGDSVRSAFARVGANAVTFPFASGINKTIAYASGLGDDPGWFKKALDGEYGEAWQEVILDAATAAAFSGKTEILRNAHRLFRKDKPLDPDQTGTQWTPDPPPGAPDPPPGPKPGTPPPPGPKSGPTENPNTARRSVRDAAREAAFDILGLKPDATPEQIEKAFRAARLKNHPDRGGNIEDWHRAEWAYETLIGNSTQPPPPPSSQPEPPKPPPQPPTEQAQKHYSPTVAPESPQTRSGPVDDSNVVSRPPTQREGQGSGTGGVTEQASKSTPEQKTAPEHPVNRAVASTVQGGQFKTAPEHPVDRLSDEQVDSLAKAWGFRKGDGPLRDQLRKAGPLVSGMAEQMLGEGGEPTNVIRPDDPAKKSFLDPDAVDEPAPQGRRIVPVEPSTQGRPPWVGMGPPAEPPSRLSDEPSGRLQRSPRIAADFARKRLEGIDVTNIDGMEKAKEIVIDAARKFGVEPNDLWRDVMYEPEGMSQDITRGRADERYERGKPPRSPETPDSLQSKPAQTSEQPKAKPSPKKKSQPQDLAPSQDAIEARWREAKKAAGEGDPIVLMRLGDYFESFHGDAPRVAKALGLTLTSRNKTTPMAGFPKTQLESALRKLLAAGHRVFVADTPESPKKPEDSAPPKQRPATAALDDKTHSLMTQAIAVTKAAAKRNGFLEKDAVEQGQVVRRRFLDLYAENPAEAVEWIKTTIKKARGPKSAQSDPVAREPINANTILDKYKSLTPIEREAVLSWVDQYKTGVEVANERGVSRQANGAAKDRGLAKISAEDRKLLASERASRQQAALDAKLEAAKNTEPDSEPTGRIVEPDILDERAQNAALKELENARREAERQGRARPAVTASRGRGRRRGVSRANEFAQKAAAEGLDLEELAQRAQHHRELDAEAIGPHNELIRAAWSALKEFGISRMTFVHVRKSGSDASNKRLNGFDDVASQMARQYPDIFRDANKDNATAHADDILFDRLDEGPRKLMRVSEAYEKAFDDMMEEKGRQAREPKYDPKTKSLVDEDGTILFSGVPIPTWVWEWMKPHKAGKLPAIPTDVHPVPPLPDYQIRKAVMSAPTGIGRIPLFGPAFDPRSRAKTGDRQAVITYRRAQDMGDTIAHKVAAELAAAFPKDPFQTGPDGMVAIANGQRGAPSDLIEAEMENPGSVPLTSEQKRFVRFWQNILASGKRNAALVGREWVDQYGHPMDDSYFPRDVYETAEGKEVSSHHTKLRMHDTEAEGVAAGVSYEPSAIKRVMGAIRQFYDLDARHQLLNDPDLQGQTPWEWFQAWQMRHPGASMESLDRMWLHAQSLPTMQDQPGSHIPMFRDRIFPEETAKYLNSHFGQDRSQWISAAKGMTDLWKTITLGADAALGQLQLATIMFEHPIIWGKAQYALFRKLATNRDALPILMRDPAMRKIANIWAQNGGTLSQPLDFLEGSSPEGLVGRIPYLGRIPRQFERSNVSALDLAKLMLFRSVVESGASPESFPGHITRINNTIGLGESRGIGVGVGARTAERLVLNAPSYLRSLANVVGEIGYGLKSVATGNFREARQGMHLLKTFGSFFLGAGLLTYLMMKQSGLSDQEIAKRFDPTDKNFAMFPVNGQEVGFGGIWKAAIKGVAKAIKWHKDGMPDNEPNPYLNFLSSRESFLLQFINQLSTGRNYFGKRQGALQAVVNVSTPTVVGKSMEEHDTWEQKLTALAAEFFGLHNKPAKSGTKSK